MRLAGKVAVVTGGGSGIGRGIVMAMAREGADIAIPDIQVLNAEKVAGEVKGLGRKVFAMKTDVTSAADVKTMIDHVLLDRTLMPHVKRVFIDHSTNLETSDHYPIVVDFELP